MPEASFGRGEYTSFCFTQKPEFGRFLGGENSLKMSLRLSK